MRVAKQALNAKQFARDIEKKPLARRYLFLGEDAGEKDRCIAGIAKRLFGDAPPPPDAAARFHAAGGEFADAVGFALAPSMFSAEALCVIVNVDELSAVKENQALMARLLDELPETVTLVLTASEKGSPKVVPAARAGEFVTVQFWRPFESDVVSHVRQRLGAPRDGSAPLRIDNAAVSLLVELLGRDLARIDEALDRILAAGVRGAVTVETVREYVRDAGSAGVFDLVEALFRRDRKSFRLLERLLADGVPELVVVSLVMRQAELIERFHSLTAGGDAVEEALERLKVYPKHRDGFMTQARAFPPRTLARVFPLIADTDRRLKSGSMGRGLVANPLCDLTMGMVLGA